MSKVKKGERANGRHVAAYVRVSTVQQDGAMQEQARE